MDLPPYTTNVCADDDGNIIALDSSHAPILVLPDGEVAGTIRSEEFEFVHWIVYHPKNKKLIAAVTIGHEVAKLVAIDPKTWTTSDWGPNRAFSFARRPIVNSHSDRLVVLESLMQLPPVSPVSVFGANGEPIYQSEFETEWAFWGLEIGNDRLALRTSADHVIVDLNSEKKAAAPTRIADPARGKSCFDPVSFELIAPIVCSDGRWELLFQNTRTWASRTVRVDELFGASSIGIEMVVVVRSDGIRLLYLKCNNRLFIFDLAQFD